MSNLSLEDIIREFDTLGDKELKVFPRILGEGTLGFVLEGEIKIEKEILPCAVKIPLPKFWDNKTVLALFYDEILKNLKIKGLNTVQIYTYGKLPLKNISKKLSIPFLAVQKFQYDLFNARNLIGNFDSAYSVYMQVIEGVKQAFQSAGIVHSDLHPRNILLNIKEKEKRIEVAISDFGFARILGQNPSIKDSSSEGSLRYSYLTNVDLHFFFPPNNLPSSKRDIYSIGALGIYLFLNPKKINTIWFSTLDSEDKRKELLREVSNSIPREYSHLVNIIKNSFKEQPKYNNISQLYKALLEEKKKNEIRLRSEKEEKTKRIKESTRKIKKKKEIKIINYEWLKYPVILLVTAGLIFFGTSYISKGINRIKKAKVINEICQTAHLDPKKYETINVYQSKKEFEDRIITYTPINDFDKHLTIVREHALWYLGLLQFNKNPPDEACALFNGNINDGEIVPEGKGKGFYITDDEVVLKVSNGKITFYIGVKFDYYMHIIFNDLLPDSDIDLSFLHTQSYMYLKDMWKDYYHPGGDPIFSDRGESFVLAFDISGDNINFRYSKVVGKNKWRELKEDYKIEYNRELLNDEQSFFDEVLTNNNYEDLEADRIFLTHNSIIYEVKNKKRQIIKYLGYQLGSTKLSNLINLLNN